MSIEEDELSVDGVFDNDADDEFNEPDELDFEMSDLVLADDDELNDVLFELGYITSTFSNKFGMHLRAFELDLPGHMIACVCSIHRN